MGPMPAAEIESAVLMQVLRVLQEPEMIIGVWREVLAMQGQPGLDEAMIVVAMRRIVDIWAQMFPVEQHRIMRLLIERVQLHPNGLDIVWREDGWHRFRRELAQHPFVVEQKDAPAMGRLGHDEEVMA